jgi:hypothetical protein
MKHVWKQQMGLSCSSGARAGAMAVAAPATVAVLLAVEAGEGGSLLGVWQVLHCLRCRQINCLCCQISGPQHVQALA